MGAFSTALAVVVTVALFRILGPKRTRLVAQIVSAVVAAAFVIGVQAAAIFSSGSFSRLALFRSESFLAVAPEATSLVYWPALAAMGDATALAVVLAISLGFLGLVIAVFSATFETHVGVTLDAADQDRTRRRPFAEFRAGSTMSALRRKEWALLRRDPWLLSQTLMQIFYLLPPILLLWLNFGDNAGGLLLLVPVLVMAAGQLAGGLAWIAVSGEDAPDLVASAPITAYAIIVAKIQAVLGAVGVVVAPLVVALAVTAPKLALVAALGIVVSAWSGTMIQFWFRPQSAPGRIRRRRIPSRIATLAEALSAILWAGTAAVAAAGSWLASVTAVAAILVLAGAWMIRPRHDNAA
jgi:ABC-2 type transport system permease protein